MHVEFIEDKEKYWSPSDVSTALKKLTDADIFRLQSIARCYSNHCSMDIDEILNEAIVRILEEKRQCPIDISLIAFIAQTMRSIAFDERRKSEKFVPIDDVTVQISDKSTPPDEKSMSSQELTDILNLFENDDDIQMLLMGIYDGYTPDEICKLAEWDRKKYSSTQKRLRRSLLKNYPNGREK